MEAVFLKLVDLSLAAGWLVLAVLALRLVFRRAPKWVHCLLWGLVGMRLACPVSIESPLSLIPPVPDWTAVSAAPPVIQNGAVAPDTWASPLLEETLSQATGGGGGVSWLQVLAWLWAIGAAGMLLYALISFLMLKRRLATATRLRGNVFQSEGVDSPFVLGLFRPVIYLPYDLDAPERDYVLAHEKAHIRRRDHWWKPLGFILLSVYWFHPLLWVAYCFLCRDIEAACDEKVVQALSPEDRRGYSRALLRCTVRRFRVAACPLAFGEVGVKERVKNVMNYKKPAFWVLLLTLLGAGAAAVCLLTDPPAEISPLFGVTFSPGEVIYQAEKAPILPDMQSIQIQVNRVLRFSQNWSVTEIGTLEETELTRRNFDDYFPSSAGNLPAQLRERTKRAYLRIFDHPDLWPLMYYVLEMPGSEKYLACGWWDAEGLSDPLSDDSTFYWVLRLESEESNSDIPTDSAHFAALTPGTSYVSWQCLYMSPLSSEAPFADSGFRYLVEQNAFTMVYRGSGSVIGSSGESLDGRDGQTSIPVESWEYTDFPYSEEEWAGLFLIRDSAIPIRALYRQIGYLPLDENHFLLSPDGALWLGTLGRDPDGSRFLWSIYSLVPEEQMGTAQWYSTPMLSSVLPGFPFSFDMDYTQITADCFSGQLVDFDGEGQPGGATLRLPAGHRLYWVPWRDEMPAAEDMIRFEVKNGDKIVASGTLYITCNPAGTAEPWWANSYTCTLVGTGLRLEQDDQNGGGIIRLWEDRLYDLRGGAVTLSANELESSVFYTNSTRITVSLSGETAAGTVVLKDLTQGGAEIGYLELGSGKTEGVFTALSAARRYQLLWTGSEDCVITVGS